MPAKEFELHPDLAITHAHFQVMDLERMLLFYRDLLGFQLLSQSETEAERAAKPEGPPLLTLTQGENVRRRPQSSTGLYHIAYRFPGRRELASTFMRLVAAQYPIQGAADHHFSEAIYLADPEGNGIELYRDRPREDWPEMDVIMQRGNWPFDLNKLLEEADRDAAQAGVIDPRADIGHMHLQVADTAATTAFYQDLLGMEMMMTMPSAVFLAAGGYHHHLGGNTWHSAGAPRRAADMTGLISYSYSIPDADNWLALHTRLATHDQPMQAVDRDGQTGVALSDQDGNRVELLTADQPDVRAALNN